MFLPKEVLWRGNLTNSYLHFLVPSLSCVSLEPLAGLMIARLYFCVTYFVVSSMTVFMLLIYCSGVFIDKKYFYLGLKEDVEDQFNPRKPFVVTYLLN